jgi:ribulose 1,5-bisphosphate synthetase/thiazole synthase
MPVLPNNDQTCGWIGQLPLRQANGPLTGSKRTKWAIIGAGYSGLSAALTLAHELPDDEIVLIDANLASEGGQCP